MGVWTYNKSTEELRRNLRMFELFDVPQDVSVLLLDANCWCCFIARCACNDAVSVGVDTECSTCCNAHVTQLQHTHTATTASVLRCHVHQSAWILHRL
jgi:hypothetical protein